jgi:gamma-glutamyl phosphate reductase
MKLQSLEPSQRQEIIERLSQLLIERRDDILAANRRDLLQAKCEGIHIPKVLLPLYKTEYRI